MINPKYALIVRDDQENRLAVVTTHREPRTGTGHNGIVPSFIHFCRSVLALHPGAVSVETVSLASWYPGADVESLPPILWIERTEPGGSLTCSFPLKEEQQAR